MSQMRIASGAAHLGTYHAETVILDFDQGIVAEGLEIAGPAGTGIKFGIGGEEGGIAADASVDPIAFMLIVFTAEGGLRAMFATNMVGLRRELLAPLLI